MERELKWDWINRSQDEGIEELKKTEERKKNGSDRNGRRGFLFCFLAKEKSEINIPERETRS